MTWADSSLCFTFISSCKHALTASSIDPSITVNEFTLAPFSLASCVRRSAYSFQSLYKCWNKFRWSAIGRMSVLSKRFSVFCTSALNVWLFTFRLPFSQFTTRLESPIIWTLIWFFHPGSQFCSLSLSFIMLFFLSCSCNPLNCFLMSKNCKYTLGVSNV